MKLIRVPDGQRLSNARLKSKGDIASERFLTTLLGDRVGPAVPTAYMFIACCAKMTAVAAITSIVSSRICSAGITCTSSDLAPDSQAQRHHGIHSWSWPGGATHILRAL